VILDSPGSKDCRVLPAVRESPASKVTPDRRVQRDRLELPDSRVPSDSAVILGLSVPSGSRDHVETPVTREPPVFRVQPGQSATLAASVHLVRSASQATPEQAGHLVSRDPGDQTELMDLQESRESRAVSATRE
jgi:hypothetical protein